MFSCFKAFAPTKRGFCARMQVHRQSADHVSLLIHAQTLLNITNATQLTKAQSHAHHMRCACLKPATASTCYYS